MTNIYGGISMLKNRTLIGIILIAAAIGLCFGISPLFNSILSSKTKIIRLKQDEAAMKNALGRISGTIPYCPKAAEYLNQGTLLTKPVDDRTYNTTIKSLAELVTKEV